MADLTIIFSEMLKRHNGAPPNGLSLSTKSIDEFLKEAYRIVRGLASNGYPRF